MSFRRQSRLANFGGTDEYGLCASASDFDYEYTQPFTLAAWFKSTSSGYLVSKFDSSIRGYGLYLSPTGTVDLLLLTTTTERVWVTTTATGFNDGAWHLAVACYSGSGLASGVTLYVDGVAQAMTTSQDNLGAGTILNTNVLNVAGRTNGSTLYIGAMAPVAVWDKVLSAVEAWGVWNLGVPGDLLVHPANANLQGYWRLGELGSNLFNNTGMMGLDESGNHRHLRFNKMETTDLVTEYILGQPFRGTKSLTFDGTNYVTMGDVLGFEYTDTFSFSCWIKTSTTNDAYIFSKRDGADKGYWLYILGSSGSGAVRFGCLTDATNGFYVETDTGLNDGEWHHIVATYGGGSASSSMTVYVDGVDMTTNATDTGTPTSMTITASFNLASRTDILWAPYDGKLYEVAAYSRVLLTAEVTELNDAGWGRKATELSSSDALVGYWRTGEQDTYPTIADRSISGNDGTMTGMAATDITGDAPTGSAVLDVGYLTSSGSLVQEVIYYSNAQWSDHGDVLAFERTDPFSVSFWIRPPGTGYESVVIGKAYYVNNGRRGWSVHRNSNRLGIRLVNTYSSNLMEVLSAEIMPSYKWIHCVVTYNGNSNQSGVTLYMNGQVAAKNSGGYNTLSATILPGPTQLTMGALESGAGWKMTAHMAQVAVWDKVLSAAEVLETFGGGEGRPANLMDVSCSPNLVFWSQNGTGDGDLTTLFDNSPSGFHGTTTGITGTSRSYPYPLDQDASLADRSENSTGEVLQSFDGQLVEVGADNFADQPRLYYRMRGWNTNTLSWETWTSADEPDLTPPVGPCVNVSVSGEWS